MRSETRKCDGKFSSNWEGPFRIREVAVGGISPSVAVEKRCTEDVEFHAPHVLL